MFYTKGIQNYILYIFMLAHQYFLKSILVCNRNLNILKKNTSFSTENTPIVMEI